MKKKKKIVSTRGCDNQKRKNDWGYGARKAPEFSPTFANKNFVGKFADFKTPVTPPPRSTVSRKFQKWVFPPKFEGAGVRVSIRSISPGLILKLTLGVPFLNWHNPGTGSVVPIHTPSIIPTYRNFKPRTKIFGSVLEIARGGGGGQKLLNQERVKSTLKAIFQERRRIFFRFYPRPGAISPIRFSSLFWGERGCLRIV